MATPADGGAAVCAPPETAATPLLRTEGPYPCDTILSVDHGPADGGLTDSGARCCYLVKKKSGVCLGFGP